MREYRRHRGRLVALAATACLAGVAGAGCSASTESAQVGTVTVEKTTPAPTDRAPKKPHKVAPRPPAEFKHCDANIEVRATTTTCEFAQNVFWHYWTDGQSPSLSVYSPTAGATLSTSCNATGVRVVCTTADRGVVRFSQGAVDSYSSDQAAKYAVTHDLGPNVEPEPSEPEPEPSEPEPDPDVSGGDEIPNYDEGRGYRVQCADGMYSKSGGIAGACSGHGGLM